MKQNNTPADSFIRNEAFQQWVLAPTPESDVFWEAFLKENPHQREALEEARRFLQVFTPNRADILESRISNLKKRINQSIKGEYAPLSEVVAIADEFAGHHTHTRKSRPVYWAAAACIIVLAVASFILLRTNVQEQTTQKGHRSVITLEDGTKIWLNADSRLEYPKTFAGNEKREVYLEGEAFFEVSKNKHQPFVVHTSDINIIVLGTSFNVRSYQNLKNIETTLVEGKITIEERAGAGKHMAVLPNQQVLYKKETSELVLQPYVNTEKHTGWRNGRLNFENTPLGEIIPSLERWYNVTIHIDKANALSCPFSAKIENNTLEEVLDLFKDSEDITYEIKGSDVYIHGLWCQE